MKYPFEAEKEIAVPKKADIEKLNKVTEDLVQKVNKYLIRKKIDAEFMIGGSVGKGTWLPGNIDIDCFLRFGKKYRKQPDKLSNITEEIIKKLFTGVQRLHGSRDYFQFEYKGYTIEIIPVFDIWKANEALNITDVSPLHVNYVKIKTEGTDYKDEIRMLKQFMKAQGVYGAESYISGFSGYVAELLSVYYGGFIQVLVHIASMGEEKGIMDPERHYKNDKEILKIINKSKQQGPMILIDPVQKERNAAAALSKEKYEKFRKASAKYLKNRSTDFFKIKYINIKDLIKNKGNRKLFVLKAKPESKRKIDIAGAKLKAQYDYIKNLLIHYDFKILETDWQWDKKSPALFWFHIDSKNLSKTKRHLGPMLAQKDHVKAFKTKYKNKVKTAQGRTYVDLPRSFTKAEDFFSVILQTDKKLKTVKLIYPE